MACPETCQPPWHLPQEIAGVSGKPACCSECQGQRPGRTAILEKAWLVERATLPSSFLLMLKGLSRRATAEAEANGTLLLVHRELPQTGPWRMENV